MTSDRWGVVGAMMGVPAGILLRFERAMQARRVREAVEVAQSAAAAYAGEAVAWDMVRGAMVMAGRLEDALAAARRVRELEPARGEVWLNEGLVLAKLERLNEAAEKMQRAADLLPDSRGAWVELLTALIRAGRLSDAEERGKEAVKRFGSEPEIVFRLASALCEQGRAREAAAELSRALFERPGDKELALTQCAVGIYSDEMKPEILAAMHRNFGRVVEMGVKRVGGGGVVQSAGKGRVRVGVISSDLRQHAVGHFAGAVLEGLDRKRFELVVYSTSGGVDDEMTRRLKVRAGVGLGEGGAKWVEAGAVTNAGGGGGGAGGLAERIARDRGGVLIDLNGLTEGGCWDVLAMRPAAVQMTYLGYPGTTGLSAVTHRLVDVVTDPVDARVDAWHTEKLVRMDGCFVCYEAVEEAVMGPDRSAGGSVDAKGIVFGSFNRLAKVGARTLDAWAMVLKAVEGSRLMIKSGTLRDAAVGERVRQEFARRGVDAQRVEVRAGSKSIAEHLGQYRGIDIALDTLGYCGTTTTCEALMMGVPVV
ncbi:MAG: tetratricopeptide repeat protein, partial [Phycisphaerales bacterium]|nr:tetratricopeptide repeat protein [Phycisphaerales bacterium]